MSRWPFLSFALLAIYAVVFVWTVPFNYQSSHAGRYLLPVIHAVDHEVFNDDPLVQSFAAFESLFYDALAKGMTLFHIDVLSLDTFMAALYALARILLVGVLFLVTRSINKSPLLFILLATWAAYPVAVAVGGDNLFANGMTHHRVSEILGLLAVFFMLRQRYLFGWLILSLAVFIHSLHALHLAIALGMGMVLFQFITHKRLNSKNVVGMTIFALSCGAYLYWLAPPSFSPIEAEIFIESKGDMAHISPFNQSLLGWGQMIVIMMLAVLSWYYVTRHKKQSQLLVLCMVSAAVMGTTLAFIAVATDYTRLMLMQPMRIFIWVYLFAIVLLLDNAVQALSDMPETAALLLGTVFLQGSTSRLVVMGLGLIFFAVWSFKHFQQAFPLPRIQQFVRVVFFLLFLSMIILFLSGDMAPYKNARQIEWIILVFMLLLVAHLKLINPFLLKGRLLALGQEEGKLFLIGLFCVAAIFLFSYRSYEAFAGSANVAWDEVRYWARDNTDKSSKFLTTVEGNFRILSLRTAVGENQSAEVWVNPLQYQAHLTMWQAVQQACGKTICHLGELYELAHKWGAQYIVLAGDYDTSQVPIYQVGDYAVFEVQEN